MPSGKQGFSEMGNSKCTLYVVKPEMEIWLLIVMRSSQKNTHKTSLVLKVLLTRAVTNHYILDHDVDARNVTTS